MDEELQALQERIERLLRGSGRLAQENQVLRAELADLRTAQQQMVDRMTEARKRVEAVLSRLPALATGDK